MFGENIGDLGGFSFVYCVYKLLLEGKLVLVIDGMIGDQCFFLVWVQVWCGKVCEEQEWQYFVIDLYLLLCYWINGIVCNFDEWYVVFGVKFGDKFYLLFEQCV